MKPSLIITNDGSHSLRVEELNETYHSIHGALQEARHVFLKEGFYQTEEEVSILEIGFGTGLNAFITMLEAHKTVRKVNYTGIEKFPVSTDMIQALNYGQLLGEPEWFDELHLLNWEMAVPVSDYFTLTKLQGDIATIDFAPAFHIIYFDAFAPDKQPEMWSKKVFAKMHEALLPGGILVTYCAKGQVKRDLKEVGFQVESVPGPPGKREMIRARKNG
ncbi:MAG: tRNA (5-methylaminomethyl-2-thiouridine)(34)-methyltransferase MnmD [Flavobacteriales bacterium]